eukprot:gene3589-4471_t
MSIGENIEMVEETNKQLEIIENGDFSPSRFSNLTLVSPPTSPSTSPPSSSSTTSSIINSPTDSIRKHQIGLASNNISNVLDLPNEVTIKILSLLEPTDINSILLTTKALNGLCWIEIKSSGDRPSARYQNTSTVIGKHIYYIGGQEKPELRFNDIYKFDTETNTFEKVIPVNMEPPRFARHCAVGIGHKIFTHGGFDGFSNHYDLCVYDTEMNTWTHQDTTGDVPIPRTNHAATALDKYMFIFGGMYKDQNERLVFLNDLYRLDTETFVWTKINPIGELPPPKCGHKLVTFDNKLLLFGGGFGGNWDKKYNHVHIYDPIANSWILMKVMGEAPVCTFTVSFSAGPFLFVFGGQSVNDDTLTNDFYMLDTVNMAWTKIETQCAPFPRDMGSGSIVGSTMYMFGGFCINALDSLYELNMKNKFETLFISSGPKI